MRTIQSQMMAAWVVLGGLGLARADSKSGGVGLVRPGSKSGSGSCKSRGCSTQGEMLLQTKVRQKTAEPSGDDAGYEDDGFEDEMDASLYATESAHDLNTSLYAIESTHGPTTTSSGSNKDFPVASLLQKEGALNILTWNPHWECFSSGHWISENCKQGATDYLNQLLVQGVDFANIVELMDDSYQAPAGYGMLHSTCRWDRTTLMWNQATWTAVGEPTRGCMEAYKPDRSFIVQVFEHRGNSGMRLAVVGAHFPHGSLDRLEGINELGNAIRNTGIDKVIFAADVNQEQYVSSTSIMQRMGVPNAASSVSTELLPSCCKNDGFSHTYDRVIANFGAAMGTTMLMDPLPEFASTGTWAFHKGMLGKLQVPTLAMA